jgi:hypothetical protein
MQPYFLCKCGSEAAIGKRGKENIRAVTSALFLSYRDGKRGTTVQHTAGQWMALDMRFRTTLSLREDYLNQVRRDSLSHPCMIFRSAWISTPSEARCRKQRAL